MNNCFTMMVNITSETIDLLIAFEIASYEILF